MLLAPLSLLELLDVDRMEALRVSENKSVLVFHDDEILNSADSSILHSELSYHFLLSVVIDNSEIVSTHRDQ